MALDKITIDKTRAAAHWKQRNEYARVASNLVYQRFTKILPSTTTEEHFISQLESQVIRDFGPDGGGVDFSELVFTENVFYNHFHKWGTRISEAKFTDMAQSGILGADGIKAMSEAVKQATQKAAYLPQALTTGVLRAGTGTTLSTSNGNSYSLKCYDGLSLFNDAHPVNFKHTNYGTYANYFHGAPSATNPGFLPLGGPFVLSGGQWIYSAGADVSIEDGWNNLWLTIAWLATMKMPDGETPRYLSPTTISCSKQLQKNVDRILDAKNIAVHAGSGSAGGGSMDIEGSIKRLGFKEPTILHELSAPKSEALNGTVPIERYDWFLNCEDDNNASELGSINLGMRMPWNVKIFSDGTGGGAEQYELAIEDMVAAIGKMRIMLGVGEPQYLFKIEAPRA
jgi:hypothetical protein